MKLVAPWHRDDRIFGPVFMTVLVVGVVLRMMTMWILPMFTWEGFAEWFLSSLPWGLALDHVLHFIAGSCMLLLIWECIETRRAALSVRRGRVVGCFLAACVLMGIHLSASTMRRAVDMHVFRTSPPSPMELNEASISFCLRRYDDRHEVHAVELHENGELTYRDPSGRSFGSTTVTRVALSHLRTTLARTDYFTIDDDTTLRVPSDPSGHRYVMEFCVGGRSHVLQVVGSAHAALWGEHVDEAPSRALLQSVAEVWGAVLATLGHDDRYGLRRRWQGVLEIDPLDSNHPLTPR